MNNTTELYNEFENYFYKGDYIRTSQIITTCEKVVKKVGLKNLLKINIELQKMMINKLEVQVEKE